MDQPDPNARSGRQLAELLALAFTAPPAEESPAGEQQLGEYRLLRKLGEGGMGTVYQARHVELDRVVAVKVLRPGRLAAAEAAARFRREIKLTSRLDHPHVVRAFDARTIGDTHFLVTEYVDGCDLQTMSNRLGGLAVPDACEIIRQAALGLQCAHEHGLVHRDIKPSNLMLSRGGQIKILDLGLARVVGAASASQQVTLIGQVVGTPDYIAPEQVTDSSGADIGADIYSLGCTLYALLVGRPPFSGPDYGDAWDKLEGHLHRPIPAIRAARPDVPAAVAGVLERMVAKDRKERFSIPGEVVEALALLAAGADLPRLLARAEGDSAPQPAAAPRDPPPATINPARDRTTAASLSGRRGPRAIWNRWWVVALGAALFAVAGVAGLLWRAGNRPADGVVPAPSTAAEAEPRSTGDAVPSPETPAGWIVFSWNRPGAGKPDLWLFRADGQRRTNITREPAQFHLQPKFSPDGRWIAFIRGAELTARTEVWVCRADGSDGRRLVAPQGPSERLGGPVWLSNTRVGYARDPVLDRSPDVEFWQIDVDGGTPQRLFRFSDAFGEGCGLVTDAAPDGRQLAAIVQTQARPATADVFLCDLRGQAVRPLWKDADDDRKDSRALWSRDGLRIAWQHQFTASSGSEPPRCGVGLARLDPADGWTAELQPADAPLVVPLAWSPSGPWLLCARIQAPAQRASAATLFCMDDRFATAHVLFELEPAVWLASPRELGRLADWALVPDDAAPAGTETRPALPDGASRH